MDTPYIARCKAQGHKVKYLGAHYWAIHYTWNKHVTIVYDDGTITEV